MNLRNTALAALFLSPLTLYAADNFAEATEINFLSTQTTLTVPGNNSTSTAEDDEPDHAGVKANASFWYALTVDEERRVEILGQATAGNLVMALYTGSSFRNLKQVSRFNELDLPATSQSLRPDDEPFIADARLSFSAKPGTTYFLAIDGENNSKGAFTLTLSTSRDSGEAKLELVPPGASWEVLQALTGTTTSNPATNDPDFVTTWQTAEGYDGPEFSAPRPTPLGYGTIDGEPVLASRLTTPATGQRAAVIYLRTSFRASKGIQAMAFEGLVDDGAIIYVNGTEVARMNVNGGAAAFNTLAAGTALPVIAGPNGSEVAMQYATATGLNIRSGQLVEIAVSVHNASATSSDSGFNMRVFATETDPDAIQLKITQTEFSDSYRITWDAVEGASYNVEYNEDLQGDDWEVVNRNPITADRDGPEIEFVQTDDDDLRGFWRVVFAE